MDVYELEWHDGSIGDIHVEGNGAIHIVCDLYPSSTAKTREKFSLSCNGLVAFACTIDFLALLNNRKAGNINNGRIESLSKSVSVLKLFLSDGYIQITAKKITISPHVARL